ncbi:MAG: cupin domain-containing protein [Spirochaetaceae bacterium]
MKDNNYWIKKLNMEEHPEGGYFSLFYKSDHNIDNSFIGLDTSGTRPLSTSIYFLIKDREVSNFHRLKSDEIWYFHDGEPLIISMINIDGSLISVTLGVDIDKGECPQVLVPAGTIFGSYVKSGKGYSLVGCMVSFGFDFEDFELFSREELIKSYPKHSNEIIKLTRN